MSVTVRLPPIDELAERWHAIAPLLRKATVRTGCYEPIDLLRGALVGRYGIWVCETKGGIDAAVATEIVTYPQKRILEILFIGGSNMRQWLPELVRVLDRHAKNAGCSHIASMCRPGWARAWGGEVTDVVVVRGIADV